MTLRLILLLGGARSGKSALAVRWAQTLGGDAVTFLATARAEDDEMRQRIAAHRAQRPDAWRTLETPRHVGVALRRVPHRVAILDCLTLLVANAWLEEGPAAVDAEITGLLRAWRAWGGTLLVVSNEVGMGIVPVHPLARAYRDALGWVHQRVRAEATQTYLVVAGGVIAVEEPGPRP